MKIGVVISTIGRVDKLNLTFASLAEQTHAPHHVVIVDQSGGTMVAERVAEWRDRLPLSRITTERGVSLGRNAGWQALDGADVVVFPDDDITLEAGTLAAISLEFATSDIVALGGRLSSGDRIAFLGGRGYFNRRDVWTKTIESTTFYRMSALREAGGFDVTLGVGCPTQWQSGEGTDLLLRVMERGQALYEPSIVLTEHMDPVPPADYLRKVRKYGRGTGRVYKLRYNAFECTRVIARPFAAAAAHLATGRVHQARVKWHAALGRVEGMLLSATDRPVS